MNPVTTESSLRHHAIIVFPLFQVSSKWILANFTDNRGQEPNEELGHEFDRMVNLRFGIDLDYLSIVV